MTAQIPPGNGDAHPTPPVEVELARFSIVLKGNRQVLVENFPVDPALGRAMLFDAMFAMETFYRKGSEPQRVAVVPTLPPGL